MSGKTQGNRVENGRKTADINAGKPADSARNPENCGIGPFVVPRLRPADVPIRARTGRCNAVAVVNLSWGWTLVGWVVAMRMALSNMNQRGPREEGAGRGRVDRYGADSDSGTSD